MTRTMYRASALALASVIGACGGSRVPSPSTQPLALASSHTNGGVSREQRRGPQARAMSTTSARRVLHVAGYCIV